jgi:hypothetical protein
MKPYLEGALCCKTAQVDVDLVARRLKIAQQDYEARYGKAKD